MDPKDRRRLVRARAAVETSRERFVLVLTEMRQRYTMVELARELGVSKQAVAQQLKHHRDG